MIKVVAKQEVKADKLGEFISLAKQLVQQTNQNDAGCLHYDLYQDTKNPQILTFIEEWDSQENLGLHMEATHFKEIFPQLQELVTGSGEVNLYKTVSASA